MCLYCLLGNLSSLRAASLPPFLVCLPTVPDTVVPLVHCQIEHRKGANPSGEVWEEKRMVVMELRCFYLFFKSQISVEKIDLPY